MNTLRYPGTELKLFRRARNWKNYWAALVKPYVSGHVLEVGAGIGNTTLALSECDHASWTCLEPDSELAAQLRHKVGNPDVNQYQIIVGRVADLNLETHCYDAVLYIDVLEHIHNDADELTHASGLLNDGGRLIILSPAHQWLFSEFDRAIGHHRRYNKQSLSEVIPVGFDLIKSIYLDSVGLSASFANRYLLGSAMPDQYQIAIWDKIMVPCSRFIDPVLCYGFGKSILGIWQKNKIGS